MARGRGDFDVAAKSPPSDVYTGLLVISLVAMITGCVFLFLDSSEYQGKPPQLPKVEAPTGTAPPPPPAGEPAPM